jgi:hypothetical protein
MSRPNQLENIIGSLQEAMATYDEIAAHDAAFRAKVDSRPKAKLHPRDEMGEPIRNFCPINMADQYMDIGSKPIHHIGLLERQGLIFATEIDGKWMARLMA